MGGVEQRVREILARVDRTATQRGAEIGVYQGRMSARLLRQIPRLHLTMVDNWASPDEQPERYRATGDRKAVMPEDAQRKNKRLASRSTAQYSGRREILHMDSVEAAGHVRDGSLDWIFIDGDHSYEGCRRDIEAWEPNVKGGGWVSGHDYAPEWPGVVQAVDEYVERTEAHLETGQNGTWFVRKGLKRRDPTEFEDTRAALILGGAECVWEDIAGVERMIGRTWDGMLIAINDVGCLWPRRIDHWVSLHPDKFKVWIKERAKRGHPSGYETWGRRKRHDTDHEIKSWAGGSSGLLAVAVAYELGASRIILAGVPLDTRPHFAESIVHRKGKKWSSAGAHFKSWRKPEVLGRLEGRVKSMSGRTRDLLGEPTREWLEGE